MNFFAKPKELQVLHHVNKLSTREIQELQLIHYGYLSSKIHFFKVKHLLRRIPCAEFSLALETKGQPLKFATYRCFGNCLRAMLNARLGQKLYIRCVAVNEGEDKWFLVLETSPADELNDFPLKYRDQITPEKINRLKV